MDDLCWEVAPSGRLTEVCLRAGLATAFVGDASGVLSTLSAGRGLLGRSTISRGAEIRSIQLSEAHDRLLIGAGQRLYEHVISTGEQRAVTSFPLPVSCLLWDEGAGRLYVGLWSRSQDNILAYEWRSDGLGTCIWHRHTGDIVRSVCRIPCEQQMHCVAVGSESGDLSIFDDTGEALATIALENRVTRLRAWSRGADCLVLVLTDSPQLTLLRTVDGKVVGQAAAELDSRAREGFFYPEGSSDHVVATTNGGLYVFNVGPAGLHLRSRIDIGDTAIGAVQWWPEEVQHQFLVRRGTDELALYRCQAADIVSSLNSIAQAERARIGPRALGTHVPTHERVYAIAWDLGSSSLYYVSGDGCLCRVRVAPRYRTLGLLAFTEREELRERLQDRLRALSVHRSVLYIGGENGVVYDYSVTDHRLRVASQWMEGQWIYQHVFLTSHIADAVGLLSISSRQLSLFDKELELTDWASIDGDVLRCGCWDQDTGDLYAGSEEGWVYKCGKLTPTLEGGFRWSGKGFEPIRRAESKVRCMRVLRIAGEPLFVIGSEDGHVRALGLGFAQKWDFTFQAWVREVTPLVVGDKELLAVVGKDTRIAFIDIATGNQVSEIAVPFEPRTAVGLICCGRPALVVSGIDSGLWLYNLKLKHQKVVTLRPSRVADVVRTASAGLASRFTWRNAAKLVATITGLVVLNDLVDLVGKLWRALRWLVGR